ncbi:MAG: hypothetical protein DRI90_23690, partial [Deltaproteobacteria bacterium]
MVSDYRLSGTGLSGTGLAGSGLAGSRTKQQHEGEAALLLRLLAEGHEGLWILSDRLLMLERLVQRLGTAGAGGTGGTGVLRVALPPLTGFHVLRRCQEEEPGREELGFALAPGGGAAQREGMAEGSPESRKVPDPPHASARHRLLEFAKNRGVEVVAAPLVLYADPQLRALHRLAVACKKGRLFDRVQEGDCAPAGSCFPQASELAEGYADLPEALREAERLAMSCTLDLAKPRAILFPASAGEPASAGAVLRARAEAGFYRLYDGPSAIGKSERRVGQARRRLTHELGIVEELGFASYFLVVDEIVQMAKNHGIPCLGRGSAADSLISYCLGFTDADPLHYRLCFERFLNAERFRRGIGDPLPDIDLDFCWRRRDELLELVARRFGEDRVALLSTQPTLGFRSAWRETARAFGVPQGMVDRRARGLPRKLDEELVEAGRRGDFGALEPILQSAPEFRRRLNSLQGAEEKRREARLWWGAFGLTGAHRCLGLHPGGTVLAPEPARYLMPLERAAKGLVCVQWDKHVAPHMGLVKIDLLGNRGLSIFEDAGRELLRLGTSVEVVEQMRETPEEDELAAELARSGRTLGIFQIESPGMRGLMTRVEARRCEDLTRCLALIRPGPAGSGMLERYVQRVRGNEPVPELPLELQVVLGDSKGVMLYQEDVIEVLAALTGLSLGKADVLRRELGKRDAKSERAQQRYFELCSARGLPDELAWDFWKQVERFGAYAFNKAHAVTYGRLSWRLLRMKARQPAALFAAILANDTGYYEKRVYVEEAKRSGVPVMPPCINRSALAFQAERQGAGGRPALRVGLSEVRELPQRFCETLLVDRVDRGPFFSVGDLVGRIEERGLRVEEGWIERLILVGAFDLLEGTRPEKLWRFRIDFGRRRKQGIDAAGQPGARPASGELFPGALELRAPVIPCLPEFSMTEQARYEIQLLGYPTGQHAIELEGPPPSDGPGYLPLSEIPSHVGRVVHVRAWLSAQRRFRTRRGEWMCFLTLEDQSGMIEAVLFPQAWRRHGAELAGQAAYHLRGSVEARDGAIALHADFLERLS